MCSTQAMQLYYVHLLMKNDAQHHNGHYILETVQDFLIKLGIKPLMHLLEISIFPLNNDIDRLTKIMNNLVKDLKILSFKVIFQCLELVESFKKI